MGVAQTSVCAAQANLDTATLPRDHRPQPPQATRPHFFDSGDLRPRPSHQSNRHPHRRFHRQVRDHRQVNHVIQH
jgi:hypothetical protein